MYTCLTFIPHNNNNHLVFEDSISDSDDKSP